MQPLRSRRLAVTLLTGLGAYSILTTAIPQRATLTAAEFLKWQTAHPFLASLAGGLGLHRAYWSPLFLIPAVLLTVSTAACSYDRTKAAVVYLNLAGEVPDKMLLRLRRSPSFSLTPVDSAGLDGIESRLHSIGLRTRNSGGVLIGRSRLWAAIGSAIFHWSLVLLFVVVAVGQLTKWEGQIGIPVGHGVVDKTQSYGLMARGALAAAAPNTGYEIRVPSMEMHYIAGGVERDHAPFVELRQGSIALAKGYVYPNSPLVHRGLYIHRGEWGLGMVAALETSAGEEVGRRNFLFDFSTVGKSGRITINSEMPPELGVSTLRFDFPLDPAKGGGYTGDLPRTPRIEVTQGEGADSTMTVLSKGDVIRFEGGQLRLRVVDLTRYTRLFVVHDPSIPVVYACLVIAMLGGALAVLVHPRAVIVQANETEDAFDVLVLAKRIDPLFAQRVRLALGADAPERTVS